MDAVVTVVVLWISVFSSSDGSTVLDIGVITQDCTGSDTSNQTLTSTTSWNDQLDIQLHWTCIDNGESYTILRSVKDFGYEKVDLILLTESQGEIDVLSQQFPGSVPVLNLGDVKPSKDVVKTRVSQTTTSYNVDTEQTLQCPLPSNVNKELLAPIKNDYKLTLLGSNFLAVVHQLQWKAIIILYEKSLVFYLDQMMRTLSDSGVFIWSHEIDGMTKNQFFNLLQNIDAKNKDTNVNITIISYKTLADDILTMAGQYVHENNRRSSMSLRSLWLVFRLDDDDNLEGIRNLTEDIDNVAVVTLPNFITDRVISDGRIDVLQLLRKTVYTLGSNSTMMTINQTDFIQIFIEHLQEQQLQRCHWSSVQTLMFTSEGRSWSSVGYVSIGGQTAFFAEIFPNMALGFNGRRFHVTTLEWAPFVMALPNNTYTGLCFDLLDHMAASLNFTYDVTNPEDGQWGVLNSNGTWTGLVGQLERWEVDLVAAPLSAQANREKVMDFTYSYYIDYTTILMKKPDPYEKKWRTLIDPFSEQLLLCVLLSLPVMSLLLFLFERFSPYYVRDEEREGMSGLHTYQDAFWYMYGALLTQGGEHLPQSQTGRTLLSSWWLFCIIMMATYSGNLIAFLTVTKDKPPFSTVAGMIQNDNYRWGTIGGSSWIDAFNETRVSTFMKVWEGMLRFNASDPSTLSPKSSVHFEKVLAGDNYAYIGDKTQMEIKMAEECSLLMADDEFLPLQYAFGFPNFSPYTKLFSDELLYVHESGLLHIWKTRRWPQRSFCASEMVTVAKTITLMDVQSAFYLIGIGVGLAALVFGLEKFAYWYKIKVKGRDEKNKLDFNVVNIKNLDPDRPSL
ncbi:glutamate receptor ionotropic, delta-1-like [Argopecten irradians]|uniref:glutamate receptor ionotropic, delta-1-like n=1 Tax=Argopecten irradians TaxID=31199 RepID=UPI003721D2D3